VAHEAAREAHQASERAQNARERLQQTEEARARDKEKIASLTAELQEIKDKELRKQHIAYLREQQAKQAASPCGEIGSTLANLASVAKEHAWQLWKSTEYREEWEYSLESWSSRGHKLGTHAWFITTHMWDDGDGAAARLSRDMAGEKLREAGPHGPQSGCILW